MSSINLLRTEGKENVKQSKRKYFLRLISIIFLFFVAVSSITLFILANRLSPDSIKKEQDSVLKSITSQKDKQAKYALLTDRLLNINQILKSRKNYTNTLNALIAQVPDGVSTTAMSVDNGNVTFTVSSNSLLSINKFLTGIIDTVKSKHIIRDMTIETLTVDKTNGLYSLSIKAKII
jgi:type II secretory pathway component PulL